MTENLSPVDTAQKVGLNFGLDNRGYLCYTTPSDMKDLLKLHYENAKLKGIWHFSLPSGYTCPGAKNCYTKVHRKTGKIVDLQTPDENGDTFRCYAAMDEARYPSVNKARWHNFNLLKQATSNVAKVRLIAESIKASGLVRGGTLRVHIGGDYYNQSYFNAWMTAAYVFPNIVFYSYTKSIHFLVEHLRKHKLPKNFVFTCSKGGKFDDLIPRSKVKSARVFFSKEQADSLGLDIDHTDDLAISGSDDFALVLHGSQPAKSKASKALSELKKNGFAGYNKNRAVPA